MRYYFQIMMIAAGCLLGWTTQAQNYSGCPEGDEYIEAVYAEMEKEVLALVNEEREKRGLNALEWDENLAYGARYHAGDMATENYFDHNTNDRKGRRLIKQCSTFERIGKFDTPEVWGFAENIAAGSPTAKATMNQWMTSSGHKENILDKDATHLGVGVMYYRDSEYGYYWVQCIGKQR